MDFDEELDVVVVEVSLSLAVSVSVEVSLSVSVAEVDSSDVSPSPPLYFLYLKRLRDLFARFTLLLPLNVLFLLKTLPLRLFFFLTD